MPSRTAGLKTGDTFALDFVTGYTDGLNDTGRAGAALLTAEGTAGDFHYQSGNQSVFDGKTITGQPYVTEALTFSGTERFPAR